MNRKKCKVSNDIDLNYQAVVSKMHLISPIILNLRCQVGAYSVQKGIHGLEDTPRVSDSGGEKKDVLKNDLNKIRDNDKWIYYINHILVKS